MEVTMNGQKIKFGSKRMQGFLLMALAWLGGIVNGAVEQYGVFDLINPEALANVAKFGEIWFYGGVGHAITKKGAGNGS